MMRIFGPATLPICANIAQQDRLLELLVQRQWDTMAALAIPRPVTEASPCDAQTHSLWRKGRVMVNSAIHNMQNVSLIWERKNAYSA